MHRSEPFLKMSLLILLFLGLAEACTPREGNASSHALCPLCTFLQLGRFSWAGFREKLLKSNGLLASHLDIHISLDGHGGVTESRLLAPALGDTLVSASWFLSRILCAFGETLLLQALLSSSDQRGSQESPVHGTVNGETAVAGSSRAGREGYQHQSSPWFSPVKPFSGTTPSRKPLPKRKNTWNFLKCAYMVITYLFVSYNKGDWCYCHYCNSELDIRDDPCCSF
ncbi:PREDICTED: uncharacterized protein LOC105582919 [Cercocebus atys]|uniref:uncharacterized protein LOC105582919 n=1 Tax=Cercocebus atys TaxID=9531 RepID=UPI0005F4799F|nr:PREDICTED: uncharacterized protein LOC105582919 [Cercocebus atys]